MVRRRNYDEFYTVHYLPLLIHPDFPLDMIYQFNSVDEEIEYFEEHFGMDEYEDERIEFPDILVEESLRDALMDADWDEVARAIYYTLDSERLSELLDVSVEEIELSKEDDEERILKLIKEELPNILNEFEYDDLREIAGTVDPSGELEILVFNDLYESVLIYNYVYEPMVWDPEVAMYVGLVPFKVSSLKLLGLGGCGMDLSPLLDAYQVLVDNSIDPSSKFFSDPRYAKYVVGEKVFNKVMEILETT